MSFVAKNFKLLAIFALIGLNDCFNRTVHWVAPFLSGGGYCSEAHAFLYSLLSVSPKYHQKVIISHFGDSINPHFFYGLSLADRTLLTDLMHEAKQYDANIVNRKNRNTEITICHAEPGAWHAPKPNYYTANPCPTTSASYRIGRTMFETDRLPSGWIDRLNYMDEIWIPTDFSRDIFLQAGVTESKLVTIGQPINTDVFRPYNTSDILQSNDKKIIDLYHQIQSKFSFLFIEKWETRKNVNGLLTAYYEQFATTENVCLIILTNSYHNQQNFETKINEFLQMKFHSSVTSLCLLIISELKQSSVPLLYHLANIVVIPSHGEGWGRPHMEAMACGVPVIATNWSGPTEFITEANGYPLRIHGLIPVPSTEAWTGHYWSNPDIEHLKILMQHAYDNPHEVKLKGEIARKNMIEKYGLEVFGDKISSYLDVLFGKLEKTYHEHAEF